MDQFHYGLLIILFLLQMDCLPSVYITDNSDSLHQVLSEFAVVRPIRTDSMGRFLPASVSGRSRRHAPSPEAPPPVSGRGGGSVFYNVTVFGRRLQLRLRPNARLIAPAASVEWWEESGRKRSQPITDTGCFYSGEVADMEDTAVAVSNCDGLAGMIRTGQEEFFIEPLDRRRTGREEEEEEEEEEGGGRQHIVYRSSAIINKHSANQTAADFLPGPLLGSLNLTQKVSGSRSRSARPRRYVEEAELLNIEVLLAVDYSVLLFHGRDHIQKYLLTLMNIVNEIYQDHSLGANINVVLVKIIMLSPSKSQELISVGNAQKSLENVCGWSYLQQRDQSHAEQHDHAIYLTRQEFGPSGMQGYAPVTGMCHLHRSCVLVFEDGFSSAFVAAHETGHVLGMEHDGEANDCEDDVPLGSIMSPRVQATFHRYHWSRCSWTELHKYLHKYDCLRDDPFHHDWPAQPPLPGFHYSMDQQCRFDFGPGYTLCTAYASIDPCRQLWCSEYSNPFYCKTKKGPPLDGTKCGPGKHCFKGLCMKLTPNLLRQDGGWGAWSAWGACSRTCGGGVQFRSRRCDSPAPANGGRTCFGNSYEFTLCSRDECPPLTDFREDQCKVWNPFFEHEGKKHHWLPYQHPDPDERCLLYCQSKETGAVASMDRMVHDGTPCSYADAHSVCVRGECEHVGCDGQIASDQQEDRCGVCGGDNSSCKIVKGNFTRSTKKQGYLKILEIPKGARHLLVQEFRETPHILAMTNLETGHVFLNDEDELPESRVVIEKGVAWEYSNSEEAESIQTSGPLQYGVLLMVRSHGDNKVTVSYKYVIQDSLRSSLESNLLQEDAVFYEWALKKWSVCSKPCGGGKQYTRFGCRRKADGKMVPRTFCSNINKPRAISRSCNTDACSSPRWVSGQWEDCSASCGQTGWQRRWVSCQQASGTGQSSTGQSSTDQQASGADQQASGADQQASSTGQQTRSVNSKLCGGNRPEGKRTCNRFPCPAAWRAGPWTPCSVSCGNGTQERQVACLSPEGSARNCSDPRPITTRACQPPPCSGDQRNSIIQWLSRSNSDFPAPNISSRQRCRGDRSVFCRMEVLTRYCSIAGYRQMCCKSCSHGNLSSSIPPSANSSSWSVTMETMTSASYISTPSPSITVAPPPSMTGAPPPSFTMTPPPSITVTPPLTSRSNTDFVYVEYEDYGDISSFEDPSVPSDTPHISNTSSTTSLRETASKTPIPTMHPATVPMVTAEDQSPRTSAVPEFPTTTTTSTTTKRTRKTAPPHLFKKKTPAPTMPVFIVTAVTTAVPEFPTTTTSTTTKRTRKTAPPHLFKRKTPTPTMHPATVPVVMRTSAIPAIFNATSSPNTAPGGRGLETDQVLSKRENNSVDEVPYRIVGLDGGGSGQGQQNYFVPRRTPPLRERTQNKRIQQLLNEKRRREGRTHAART
ncbi:A disintegrin and metalloproteinase with thrombospondin motifs 2-like isoform X2 [Sander lucioperca]|uniref:A disintegrin and metalloproteinase with thrombospondin motifs 2-like isoform X2 n=1 Tax=Sander lucioperca TaxID=283035 RepID=UPI00165357F5|nr:A disintegrin and metalloproteinase with thrombospondin motifs 2-like isoform X2 [Sander lucioperca]